MKVEYISHACLLVETSDLKIVTDPWFNGGAYCNQWHVFPRPVNTEILNDADVILISHGHEDHLHEDTLKLMPKTARVYYPYSFFGGAKEYIESIGFEEVYEAIAYKKIKLSPKTSVTFLLNSHDSIMVIESDGKVLVNANDALHSYPEKVIDFHLAEIKKIWKEIDILFCGFGGASYFPNTIHHEGKNDKEIAIVREQLFAHNFCRVVCGLRPKVAVPFAADFVLLSDKQRWINHYRFPRSQMRKYYQKHFAKDKEEVPQIYDMYPGDKLELYELRAESPYRKLMREGGSLEHLIDEQYREEIANTNKQTFISEAEAEKLVEEILRNLEKRATLYRPEKLQNLRFSLQVTDVAERNFYNISFAEGKPQVRRAEMPSNSILLTMQVRSEVLRYSFFNDWGADAISIGYGAEIYYSSERLAEIDLESVCVNLLANYPTVSDALKKSPFRVFKFFVKNPLRYTRSLRRLKNFNSESKNYNRKVWLIQTAEEIRRIYNLPSLETEFLPQVI